VTINLSSSFNLKPGWEVFNSGLLDLSTLFKTKEETHHLPRANFNFVLIPALRKAKSWGENKNPHFKFRLVMMIFLLTYNLLKWGVELSGSSLLRLSGLSDFVK
jgi:hypothetical protein